MRASRRKVRLLTGFLALAIVFPANLPAWTADETAKPSPGARGESDRPAGPALSRATPHAGWHAGSSAFADPSDEPGEGSDGWITSLGPLPMALPGVCPFDAGAFHVAAPPSAWLPLPADASCRLRC